MENATKNQHFISQSEQRSNCIDEDAEKHKKRIYKFSIVDREEHAIRLISRCGVVIKKNLSFGDLFSFDVSDDPLRKNLETYFQRFEKDLDQISKELIAEVVQRASAAIVADLSAKVLKGKLMGMIRNPFCISRNVRLFDAFLNVYPTDPDLLASFMAIREGTKPHLEKVCAVFEVTPEEYLNWLQIIFLALMISPVTGVSILEDMVDGLMSSPGSMCNLILATFDDVPGQRVALPDTSYLQGTQDPNHNMFLFNLTKCAYAAYSFVNLAKQTMVPVPPVLRERIELLGLGFSYQTHNNNLQLLRSFNSLAVYQSRKHVFCAEEEIYGVNCLSIE